MKPWLAKMKSLWECGPLELCRAQPSWHGQDCDVLTIWTSEKTMNRAEQHQALMRTKLWDPPNFRFEGSHTGAIWLRTILRTRPRRKEGFQPAIFLTLVYMKPVQIWISVSGFLWDVTVSFQEHPFHLFQEQVPMYITSLPPKQPYWK